MNTIVGVAFLAAFLVVYALDRARRAPLWFAAMFVAGLMVAVVEFVLLAVPQFHFLSFAIFTLTCLTLCFMAVGIGSLYQKLPSMRLMGAVLVAVLAANWLIVDLSPDAWASAFLRQGSYALLQGFAVWIVLSCRGKSTTDYVLAGALVFNLLQYLARPAMAAALGGQGETAGDFLSTHYAAVQLIVLAVAMLAISFSLLMLCIGDITSKLRLQANIDQATGLLNRRGLEGAVEAELASAKTDIRKHAIIIADIDHFKAVNDMFGHHAGDAVLARFAAMLKQAAGPENLAVRLGGEEFVLVLWNLPLETVEMIAEGLRTAFSLEHHEALADAKVTASFGVAYWRTDENIHTALRSADRALYRAKDRGRNRVERAMIESDTAPFYEKPMSLSA